MTLLHVSGLWVPLIMIVMYAFLALMLLRGRYHLLKMTKDKESDEKMQKMYIGFSIRFVFIIVIFILLILTVVFHPMVRSYLGPKYFNYITYVVIVCAVLAFITNHVLIRKGKVKINGIRYKLDKRSGTAMVLPNKYSGELVIPSSFINPKNGATYRVTGLDDKAFTDCGKLTSVNLPEGVTSISNTAFIGCKALKSVTIPKSVTSIEYALADCENLRDVVCLAAQVPTTPNDAFEDTPISEATLHVPAASVEAYKTTAPWSQFKNIVAIE